ncbi:hypothetical protein [Pararhodonellum marinum]|uniref:hypothetical protein n=1 Tax=Pararhodonellum marinum TaxID=2755358 RepID=UPI00188EE847|nr:hypothetical protein [Pararhodonellum marinum]
MKKIIDVKISNKEISVSRDAKISIIDLENQIKQLDYSGENKPKDPNVENASIPPFIQSFYYLFFKDLRIPTENEYCETYLEFIGGDVNGNVLVSGLVLCKDGLLNRMKRTYPSLVRDLHFIYLLEESEIFEEVEYSMRKDYFNGLDIRLIYNKIEFYVSLFIDTTRGVYFKKKKRTRHDFSTVNEIEFNVAFSSLKKVGNFYLLTPEHVKILLERVNN